MRNQNLKILGTKWLRQHALTQTRTAAYARRILNNKPVSEGMLDALANARANSLYINANHLRKAMK